MFINILNQSKILYTNKIDIRNGDRITFKTPRYKKKNDINIINPFNLRLKWKGEKKFIFDCIIFIYNR